MDTSTSPKIVTEYCEDIYPSLLHAITLKAIKPLHNEFFLSYMLSRTSTVTYLVCMKFIGGMMYCKCVSESEMIQRIYVLLVVIATQVKAMDSLQK